MTIHFFNFKLFHYFRFYYITIENRTTHKFGILMDDAVIIIIKQGRKIYMIISS